MPLKLHITDGTTTIDMDDTAGNYPLLEHGYVPAIAGLRDDALGGRGIYNDVVDEILIDVNGASAAAAYSNLAALNRLLSQARAWARGDNVTAVEIQYSPDGATVSSAANPLHATILGPADGDQSSGVSLSATWDNVAHNFIIPNVLVRFKRIGEWLAHTEDSDASTATTNGDQVTTISLAGAVSDQSPTRFTATKVGYGKTSGAIFRGGYVLIAEVSTDYALYDAEGLASGTYTSVNDAAANARNTNVLRYTPGTTVEIYSASSGAITLPTATDLIAVFVNVRHSTTTDFSFRIRIDSDIYNQFTPPVKIIHQAAVWPRWYFCGFVAKKNAIVDMYVASIASAASSFFDIDTIVLADARLVHIIGLPGASETELNSLIALATLDVNHARLTLPQPTALAGTRPIQHDELIFYTKAQALYPLLLETGGLNESVGNKWRQHATADGVQLNTWTVYRRTAYLIPQ